MNLILPENNTEWRVCSIRDTRNKYECCFTRKWKWVLLWAMKEMKLKVCSNIIRNVIYV